MLVKVAAYVPGLPAHNTNVPPEGPTNGTGGLLETSYQVPNTLVVVVEIAVNVLHG